MNRLRLLLLSEFKLARTAVPIHAIIVFQPALFFVLMGVAMVHPTFDVNVVQPTTQVGYDLVQAMREVGSPIGHPYVNPVLVRADEIDGLPQVISVETREGVSTAVQRFGQVDSNLVKNLRNRLTAAALRLWDGALGDRAVIIEEHPWLPRDVPYTVYFGMAMLPLTAFLAANLIGGILTAQEFEFGMGRDHYPVNSGVVFFFGGREVNLEFFVHWFREVSIIDFEQRICPGQTGLYYLLRKCDPPLGFEYNQSGIYDTGRVKIRCKTFPCEMYNYNWIEEGVDIKQNKIIHFKGHRHSTKELNQLMSAINSANGKVEP